MNLLERAICPAISHMLAHWYVLTPRGRLQGLIDNFEGDTSERFRKWIRLYATLTWDHEKTLSSNDLGTGHYCCLVIRELPDCHCWYYHCISP